MNAKHTQKDRTIILKKFTESKIGIICSVRVLSEGIDIKCVDTVVFVSTQDSIIAITQCVGRPLRKLEDKTIANVIIPVFIDDKEKLNNKNSNMVNLFNVVRTLQTQDDLLIDYFLPSKTTEKKSITGNGQPLINFWTFGDDNNIEIKKWIECFETKVWSSCSKDFNNTEGFEYMYTRYKEFIDNNKRYPGSIFYQRKCFETEIKVKINKEQDCDKTKSKLAEINKIITNTDIKYEKRLINWYENLHNYTNKDYIAKMNNFGFHVRKDNKKIIDVEEYAEKIDSRKKTYKDFFENDASINSENIYEKFIANQSTIKMSWKDIIKTYHSNDPIEFKLLAILDFQMNNISGKGKHDTKKRRESGTMICQSRASDCKLPTNYTLDYYLLPILMKYHACEGYEQVKIFDYCNRIIDDILHCSLYIS